MEVTLQDLMALKGMGGEGGMTPYEQVKVSHMQSKRPSGVAIAGLTLGTVGVVAGVSAWIFGGMYGSAKAKEAKETALSAKELAGVYAAGIDKRLDNISALLESEVTRRIAGDQTITQTINDTVSGSQSGQLTASQIAQQEQLQQLQMGLMTGEYSRNPKRVAIYQDAKPCPCPAGGCGM
jgi:hypothetical protein